MFNVLAILFYLVALQITASFIAPQRCSGAIVEIHVSGRVVVFDPLGLLPGEIRTGEPWSGIIRYSTDLEDRDPDPKRGEFFDRSRPDALAITVNVHGHVFAGGLGELSAETINDWVTIPAQPIQWPPGDSFGIGGPMQQSPRLLDLSSIVFSWNDPSGRALSSDALPLIFDPFLFTNDDGSVVVPEFSPIQIRIFDIGVATPTHVIQYDLFAAIESAEFRVIPEPKSITLIAVCGGLSAVVWLMRFFRVAP